MNAASTESRRHTPDVLEAAITTTVDFSFVTTVHRPELPDVHLGFVFQHQAKYAECRTETPEVSA
ncbi:hypothetical protein [Amycolatopsis sp. NPDC058986]|uniref:hypothetical protein n=1 Tax=unclassified Amycolatopsis TaxID=2618356 RepID=UPI00366AE105